MFTPTKGSAREFVPARKQLEQQELDRLQKSGALVVDERRRRPLYFDGRFLAARDLTREQAYFLTRQADLGRAGGAGIIHGLMVSPGATASSIVITPGHGITPAGESVVLPPPVPPDTSLSFNLADIAEIQRLDAAFGLLQIPRESLQNRSGLFIVALRPVEFSANPVASYPTSITGPRTVEDGDIIEGVVVTLIPYPDEGARNELDQRRAVVAREIFVEKSRRGSPASALPLAMIALNRGVLQWIDPFLVRREVGAEQSDVLGLGLLPRALREAHVLQYESHLNEVIRQRAQRGLRFAASEHFLALPPAGRMPAAAIDPTDFTQLYFPPEIDMDLSIIPEDEVAALLEDSFELPPIDLTLTGDEQESTAIQALIPLPRAQVRMFAARLTTLSRPVKPAAPGLLARRKPLEVLQGLKLPRVPLPVLQPQNLVDAAWREALASRDLLWYTRRRNLAYKIEITGTAARLTGDDSNMERVLGERLTAVGATAGFNRLRGQTTSAAAAEMVALLSSPRISASPTLTTAVVRDLEAVETLDQAAVLRVAERFSAPRLGEGIARLERANPNLRDNKTLVKNIAASGSLEELDRLGRTTPDGDLPKLARDVEAAARTPRSTRLGALVRERTREN
jgi:hypothetical protein